MLVVSSAIVMVINSNRIENELAERIDGYFGIAKVTLAIPLWNLDDASIVNFIDALFLDDSITYVEVSSEGSAVATRARPAFKDKDFLFFEGSADFIADSLDIEHDEAVIGTLRMAVSRAAIRQELLLNAFGTAVLAVLMIAAVAVASILISRRYVADPLGRLQRSASSIAGGDLDARIESGGNDEVGGLARDFDAMRQSIRGLVGELRATNEQLEEANRTLEQRVAERTAELVSAHADVDEGRNRLTDAIESISEGFALFDTDDCLVICNNRFRELYSGLVDIVEPGVAFEDIIRAAAARTLIAESRDDAEEWVQTRLECHRDPGPPFLQQQSDDRWIQISERRTGDGGTVAVYTDITELKKREVELEAARKDLEEMLEVITEHAGIVEEELQGRAEELTDKSNSLEQLSKKLSKYLSPQIYDSIFRGKREVTVTSTRKKLTVFFSDIANFTETADRLQSEELTELLNHYLTEMTQIALEYGATIDKYIGDAIMIFFGDPETKGVKEDALACVQMAIAMRKRMDELQRFWRAAGFEKPLRCRMGIHTDYCTVGNFGSEIRMDYTIIGGGVNLASRLETSATPGNILISYETFAHVSDQIACKEHGKIDVKGIAYPVATYEVIDTHEALAKEGSHFREDHPNVNLDLDRDSMSAEDRSAIASILHQALEYLSAGDDGGRSKRAKRNEINRDKQTESENDI